MKTLLVPTDFSQSSGFALYTAKKIARLSGAHILLLHVLDYSSHIERYDMAGINSEYLNELHLDLKSQGEKQLSTISNALRSEGFDNTSIIQAGFPKEVIINVAKNHNADLIVMGSNGATGMEEIFLGSNTERVIRTAPCPVLTMGKSTEDMAFENILYVSDFKENNDPGFQNVLDFAELFGAAIHMVRINMPQNFEHTQLIEKRMHALADNYGLTNYTICQWDHNNFEDGVRQYAKTKEAEIIAIGTHGRTGLGHFFLGSVAEDLANHLHMPILTYKIQKDEKYRSTERPVTLSA